MYCVFFSGQGHHAPPPSGMKVLVSLWWDDKSIIEEPETFVAFLLIEVPEMGV